MANGEFSELCGERICSGTNYSLSLYGGLYVHNSLSAGVKSKGEAILSFVTRELLQKAVMLWVGRAR